MGDNKGRVLYADILRTLTILAVFAVHVGGERWYSTLGTSEWYVLNTYMVCLRWCNPVFFMLSGITILSQNYDFSFKKLYTKSLPRLFCALIFWAVMYRVLSPLTAMLMDIKVVTVDDWKRVYTEILYGTPWHHLWFMYAIISIYFLSPLLRVFTAHAEKKHYMYFLALYFVFGAVIPKINAVNGIHISIGVYDLYAYTGYFIAGYFFSKFDLTKIEKRLLYIAGIGVLLWNIFSSIHFAHVAGYPGTQYFENISPTNMILAYLVFVLAKDVITKSKWMHRFEGNKWIILMANCSLGLYLVHDFFNIILRFLNINTGTFPAIISLPILTLLVYLASLGLVLIIKKIPVLNKWIV